jgi:hypothetical protein
MSWFVVKIFPQTGVWEGSSKGMRTARLSGVLLMKVQEHMRCRITSPIPGHHQGIHFMKHRNGKPSDHVMQFFTPELYMRFNSSDDDVANEADEEWENALLKYRKHLDAIRARMSSHVSKLAGLCLHDALLLAFEQVEEPLIAILSVEMDGMIVSLIYHLSDRVRVHQPIKDWSFSKLRVHWLYDEIDTASGKHTSFMHRILLSDGRVLEIPFTSVVTHDISPISPSKNGGSKQSLLALGSN